MRYTERKVKTDADEPLTLGDIEEFGDGSSGCTVMIEVDGKLYQAKSVRWKGRGDYTAIISTKPAKKERIETRWDPIERQRIETPMRVVLCLKTDEGTLPLAAWLVKSIDSDDLVGLRAALDEDWRKAGLSVNAIEHYSTSLDITVSTTVPDFPEFGDDPTLKVKETEAFLKNHPMLSKLKITKMKAK